MSHESGPRAAGEFSTSAAFLLFQPVLAPSGAAGYTPAQQLLQRWASHE
jgi:hypothetical protein